MNCKECQQQMIEDFGLPEFGQEFTDHLAACDECRALADELQELSASLPSDEEFYPDRASAGRIAASVSRSIANRSVVTPLRAFAVAASVLLVFTVSYFGLRNEAGNDPVVADNGDSVVVSTINTEEEFDDETYHLLFESVAADPYRSGYDILLQELSDEDLDYLEQNVDARDFL